MKLLKNKFFILALALVLLVCVFVLSLFLGAVKFGFSETVSALFTGEGTAGIIIRGLRLPRTFGALLSGAALAVAGLLLQSISANDLASPSTIGINSGAGAAVMLVGCFFPALFAWQSVLAFIGALLAAALTLGLAARPGRELSRVGVVLAGVAVGAIFSALISFLSIRFPDALVSYTAFSVGGFSGVRYEELILPAAVILSSLLISACLSPKLNVLELGDTMALTLGVRVTALRLVCVILASALAAASVSFAGLIGFVGLIAPHVASRIIGRDKRFLLPMSALVGSVLTLVSDLIGRVAFAPTELPSGIILSLIGAPFFLALLIGKGRRHADD